MGRFKEYLNEDYSNNRGKIINLSPIFNEISIIVKFLNKNKDLFGGAAIVGSWAVQNKDKMPDRKGKNTSDIDIMVSENEENNFFNSHKLWGKIVELEKLLKKFSKREIHLNLSGVTGNDFVNIWGKIKKGIV